MTIDQWLFRWDPTNFSFTALVFVLITAAISFLWLKFWPWFTREYWPMRQKAEQTRLDIAARQEQSRLDVMATIRDALVELKVIVSQNSQATNIIIEHLDRLSADGRRSRRNGDAK